MFLFLYHPLSSDLVRHFVTVFPSFQWSSSYRPFISSYVSESCMHHSINMFISCSPSSFLLPPSSCYNSNNVKYYCHFISCNRFSSSHFIGSKTETEAIHFLKVIVVLAKLKQQICTACKRAETHNSQATLALFNSSSPKYEYEFENDFRPQKPIFRCRKA